MKETFSRGNRKIVKLGQTARADQFLCLQTLKGYFNLLKKK